MWGGAFFYSKIQFESHSFESHADCDKNQRLNLLLWLKLSRVDYEDSDEDMEAHPVVVEILLSEEKMVQGELNILYIKSQV